MQINKIYLEQMQIAVKKQNNIVAAMQGAKKVSFTACLPFRQSVIIACTSSKVILTKPKKDFDNSWSVIWIPKNTSLATCALKLRREFTNPTAKSTSLGYWTQLPLHAVWRYGSNQSTYTSCTCHTWCNFSVFRKWNAPIIDWSQANFYFVRPKWWLGQIYVLSEKNTVTILWHPLFKH